MKKIVLTIIGLFIFLFIAGCANSSIRESTSSFSYDKEFVNQFNNLTKKIDPNTLLMKKMIFTCLKESDTAMKLKKEKMDYYWDKSPKFMSFLSKHHKKIEETFLQGDYSYVNGLVDKYLVNNPNDPIVYLYKAIYNHPMNPNFNMETAKNDWGKVEEFGLDENIIALEQAQYYLNSGRGDLAMEYIDKLINNGSNIGYIYLLKGLFELDNKNIDSMINYFTKGYEFDKCSIFPYYLSISYHIKGDYMNEDYYLSQLKSIDYDIYSKISSIIGS